MTPFERELMDFENPLLTAKNLAELVQVVAASEDIGDDAKAAMHVLAEILNRHAEEMREHWERILDLAKDSPAKPKKGLKLVEPPASGATEQA